MRESATWKTMFCILAALTALAAAEPPAPPLSTPEQLALLDKIPGVGSLKFGATLDSFDKGSLQPARGQSNPESPNADYFYTPTDQVTWGTLTPIAIELNFYYNQLVGIQMAFDETNATLITVHQAFVVKYGSSPNSQQLSMDTPPGITAASLFGPFWHTDNIYVGVGLPSYVPQSASDDFLTQKVRGIVDLDSTGLRNKLTHDKQEAMRTELLKGQNLDKIKADL